MGDAPAPGSIVGNPSMGWKERPAQPFRFDANDLQIQRELILVEPFGTGPRGDYFPQIALGLFEIIYLIIVM